jgi:glycerol kinase
MTHILAIDQGTTSTRAIVFDGHMVPIASDQEEFAQIYPASGWVEHDPEVIWATTLSTVREVAKKAPGPIAAIGITNQRETTWSGTATPARRSTTPSSGRTGAPPMTAALRATTGHEPMVTARRPACCSTRISPAPSSPGCSTMWTARGRRPRPASSPSAPSTAG